jgi:hypothetical protein
MEKGSIHGTIIWNYNGGKISRAWDCDRHVMFCFGLVCLVGSLSKLEVLADLEPVISGRLHLVMTTYKYQPIQNSRSI